MTAPVRVNSPGSVDLRIIEVPLFSTSDASAKPTTVYTFPADATVKLGFLVMARSVDGTSKVWRQDRTGKNVGGALALVGSLPTPTVEGDIAAASWAVNLGVTGSDLVITVQGDAVKTVYWYIQVTAVELVTPP